MSTQAREDMGRRAITNVADHKVYHKPGHMARPHVLKERLSSGVDRERRIVTMEILYICGGS